MKPSQSVDEVQIRDLMIPCILGTLPGERIKTQAIYVNLTISLRAPVSGWQDQLRQTVDYSILIKQIKFLWLFGNFKLIETGCEVCLRMVKAYWKDKLGLPIETLSIEVRKPEALKGEAIPSVKVHRQIEELQTNIEQAKFGYVDVLFENEERGIYLLNIAPHHTIVDHFHKVMKEVETAFDDGLMLQNHALNAFEVRQWPAGFVHSYHNPDAANFKTVACIDQPRFIREDEIETGENKQDLTQMAPIMIL